MCDQTQVEYLDGEVVWVKLGPTWWPGEVVGFDKLPPDVLPSFRKPPIAVVKFFQEDTYEYVKNINNIYKYNCSRKDEFIKKGLETNRRRGNDPKFPDDIIRAEKATDGDENILQREEFQERKKENWSSLFGEPKKTPVKKGRDSKSDTPNARTPQRKFTGGNSAYKAHILVQPAKPTEPCDASTPSTSRASSETHDDKVDKDKTTASAPLTPAPAPAPQTPASASAAGIYTCHACNFTTNRLNVMILHNKTHSVTYVPYTPSPVRKKTITKTPTPKSPTPAVKKTPKPRKPKVDKVEKDDKPKKTQGKKRTSDEKGNTESKKPKTDQEIKTSLLADWDDGEEENDDSKDESSSFRPPSSPEIPVDSESPARPVSDDIDSAQVPDAGKDEASDKPEGSSDAKYDFCEDEDWAVEADVGRKIPRIKNPKRKGDSKSMSMDEEDVAKEVAELLNSTTVPELPSAPEPLKVEENFPERPIEKSPDKQNEKVESPKAPETKPTETVSKTIFKTKTFFRSRHSRSQDAIGKYIAEQLNAAERMNNSDNELNGSDAVSSPEARESPPAESVRVAKLAPKIQLKKMKAEEREKLVSEDVDKPIELNTSTVAMANSGLNVEPIVNAQTGTVNNHSDINALLHVVKEIAPPIENQSNIGLESMNTNQLSSTEIDPDSYLTNSQENLTESDITINDKLETSLSVVDNTSVIVVEKPESAINEELNESTASAVDALLSVSRDPDKVTKMVSNVVPEDLFEEDKSDIENTVTVDQEAHKMQPISNNLNNFSMDVDETEYFNKKAKQSRSETKLMKQDSEPIIKKKKEDLPDADISEKTPSESDLQIAEALMNLPSSTSNTTTYENSVDSCKLDLNKDKERSLSYGAPHVETSKKPEVDFETEEDNSENLNAARSLVQMSESIEHDESIDKGELQIHDSKTALVTETEVVTDNNNGFGATASLEQIITAPNGNKVKNGNGEAPKVRTPSKLSNILEEPPAVKTVTPVKSTPVKHVVAVSKGKEKILNFDVGNPPVRSKPMSPKQKIIIRRTTPSKNLINAMTEPSHDKLILSPAKKKVQDGSGVKTYTIQASSEKPKDNNTIIIQQNVRKVINTPQKIQKISPSQSLVITSEPKVTASNVSNEDMLFDINSMPVVLSEDIVTPENIDKMPIVMSDGNLLTNPAPVQISPPVVVTNKKQVAPKIIKHKQTIVEAEKTLLAQPKPEMKTLLVNPAMETNKITTPNILSKSSKIRSGKPMLVFDKVTGKQKIIMTKAEPVAREPKQSVVAIQSAAQVVPKTEKYIILPTPNSPRPNRTQKIVIDPHTRKAHVVMTKADPTPVEAKPVSARLIPSAPEAGSSGGTVMIITNAQGTQSRIVLTPEHEKILFPNKQQPTMTQIKAIPQRLGTSSVVSQKPQTLIAAFSQPAPKTTKIVPKQQKGAIITSKGQLIVGGNVVTAAQNIAPMPEVKPTTTKRIITTTTIPKKVIQTVPKTNSEPLIFLQQKSGQIMQLTAAQFEHLQRTGQIVAQKPAPAQTVQPVPEIKPKPQKTITITSNENITPVVKQQRVRPAKPTLAPSPAKKVKQEIILKPLASAMPSLTPIVSKEVHRTPAVSNTVVVTSSSSPYTDLNNIEEFLPTTAIVREPPPPEPLPPPVPEPQPEPAVQEALLQQDVAPDQMAQGEVTTIADNQLVAVPGEHFGCAVGTFYLCIEDNGTLTPIDNRPLVLENNQLVPMVDAVQQLVQQPERRDILEAALASSDVLQPAVGEAPPDFRDLNANVSVHCRVSETSSTLHQPIMTPVEVPTSGAAADAAPASLDAGLAVIGLTPHSVPTSLELPITVTDPRIAPKTSDPLTHTTYSTTVIPTPGVDMTFVTAEVGEIATGTMSMPLLTEEDEVMGKSMPILTTEDVVASSMDSSQGSTSPENRDDAVSWTQRIQTPNSDCSETSAEIPIQAAIQISSADITQNS